MKTGRSLRLATILGAFLFSAWLFSGPVLAAGSAPYWPSEQEEKLKALDERLLTVQRQLFNARMNSDVATVERLRPLLEDVKGERLDVLRALGQVQ